MVNKRVNFLVALLFLNTTFVFSQIHISGLLQYGMNIDRQQLRLLESRQTIHLRDFTTGTYIIKNSGIAYRARLGILVYESMGGPTPIDTLEIQFFINGNRVNHTVTKYDWGMVAMDGNEVELGIGFASWALIDVLFPESSTVIIQIQRMNSYISLPFGASYVYNPRFLSFFPDLLFWSGPTEFSVEIVNNTVQRNNVEAQWISDIIFERIKTADVFTDNNVGNWVNRVIVTSSVQDGVLSVREHLLEFKQLETSLMNVQKLNGNTFRINFSEEFMSAFSRSFVINLRSWGAEGPGLFMTYTYPLREILLASLRTDRNISQRELAPYELIFLTNNQLRVMRNVFFARHGFTFRSTDLQNIFGDFYFSPTFRLNDPNPNFHEGLLTDIDRANIAVIQRLEALAGD